MLKRSYFFMWVRNSEIENGFGEFFDQTKQKNKKIKKIIPKRTPLLSKSQIKGRLPNIKRILSLLNSRTPYQF